MEQLTIPRYEIDIFWSDEDDAFVAVVPDLLYCSAWGDTYEEALSQVQSAIRGHIKVAEKYGDPIPEPRSPRATDGPDQVQQIEAEGRLVLMDSPPDVPFSYDTYLRSLGDQQRAFQDFAQQSASVYADYLNSAVSFYQQALQRATQMAQSNLQTACQVAQSGVQAASQAAQQSMEAATQAVQQGTRAANQAGQESANASGQAAEQSSDSASSRRSYR